MLFAACDKEEPAVTTTTGKVTTTEPIATTTTITTTAPVTTTAPITQHTHSFSIWSTTSTPSCASQGMQTRSCTSCGFSEYSPIPALSHTEVIDAALPATCLTDGKTAGSHCSVCNTVLTAQTTIKASGHTAVTNVAIAPTCDTNGKTEGSHCGVCNITLVAQTTIKASGHTIVTDAAVAATCLVDGKTAGSHCSVCNIVITAQTTISASGHQYDEGTVIASATCIANGTKKYTCTATNCNHSYSESYTLPTYTATEIYNQSIKYVGEIVTYDKSGAEYALGTGFVISSDGKIVTNYHVIEGAYSADITINNTKYTISSVLAYDANIDLAILKINASGLTAATICKNPVNVGSTVYAIGSSRGLTNTFSQGIVTASDRVVYGVSHVQHDASITHGNSGGPLINVYGEVIGINTWGLTDSQNLNFAVFTTELDNLVYLGTPLTLAEFYLKECDVFEKLKNKIISNGTYDASDNCYSLVLGVTYSDDYSYKFTRAAYYYIDDNKITLDYIMNEGDFWVYFTIDDTIDGSYNWYYFDCDGYKMSGILYATTYDNNSLLGYSYNNISSSSLRATIRELASTMISTLCMWMDRDFNDINVTAEDLYFYNY